VIAEHEIDTVFNDRAIAQLLLLPNRSPSAKLFTKTDRRRFTDSIHMAARCYLAEHARINWPVIAEQIRTLYRLLEKAEGGKEPLPARRAWRSRPTRTCSGTPAASSWRTTATTPAPRWPISATATSSTQSRAVADAVQGFLAGLME
jgi:hypothetical protein